MRPGGAGGGKRADDASGGSVSTAARVAPPLDGAPGERRQWSGRAPRSAQARPRPPGTSTTEGAPDLLNAIDVLWPRALRMRGGLHTRQHRAAPGPAQAGPAVKAVGVARRDAPRGEEGARRCQPLIPQYQALYPAAWRCRCDESAARLHPLQGPARPQHDGRTSHRAARAFAEERRRTKVMPPLWDAQSVRKLVLAGLRRVGERGGKKPLSACEPHQIRAVRQALDLAYPLGTLHDVPRATPPRRSAASAREFLQEKKDLTSSIRPRC